MKKSFKKILCSLMVVLMVLTSVPLSGFVDFDLFEFNWNLKAEAASELDDSGKCGDNVIYTFNSSTGELTISGSGAMKDYDDGKSPFYCNSSIKSVVIKDGVTTVGSMAFFACTSLKSVTLPDSITSINYGAFGQCTSLENIIIPDGVKTIGYRAFALCSSLESVSIPDSVTSIEPVAFYLCGSLKSVNIPDSVTNLGYSAFYMCCSLENLTLSKNLETIESETFLFCTSLKSVDIPEGVKTIGDGAFSTCISLETVSIADTVETIDEIAFAACTSLKAVNIPKSVTCISRESFAYCCSLEKITVDENNPNYVSENGVLFNKDKTELVQYPCGSKEESYTVPETVKTINEGAFEGAIFVEEIILSETLECCESGVFDTCISLKEMTLPESINAIESLILYDCYYLDKVYVKSMTAEIEGGMISKNTYDTSKIGQDDFVNLCYNASKSFIIYEGYDGYKVIQANAPSPEFEEELEKYAVPSSERTYTTTLYCHSGSTAEAYAIKNGVPYVLTHFFEGDWIYDYDQMIRYRKCIHCDEIESEPLETTKDDDTEIIAPTDPDTDFTVDKVEQDSSKYIVVEDAFKHHGPEHWRIVKAFDINMTDKNGVHVQPDGTVRVRLPLDNPKHSAYKVYRVNDDGTLTDMHAQRQGDSLVFDTDHFSLYVIVDESETADTDIDTPSGGEKDDFISRLFAFITKIIEMIAGWFK